MAKVRSFVRGIGSSSRISSGVIGFSFWEGVGDLEGAVSTPDLRAVMLSSLAILKRSKQC